MRTHGRAPPELGCCRGGLLLWLRLGVGVGRLER